MINIKRDGRSLGLSIWAVILKNFKTIFRSKSSAFVIIFGPLIVMALVGLAFNNSSLFDIRIATYSDGYSDLSNKIIEQLEEKDYVITMVNDTVDCLSGVKNDEFNVCLVFSKDMQISNNLDNNITFYVDPSRLNIVDSIISSINKDLVKTSTNLSLGLTNILVDQLFNTRDEITNKSNILIEVNNQQQEIVTNANNIKSNADSIDLNILYENFKIPELRAEIQEFNETYNFSGGDYESIINKLADVDREINDVMLKVNVAKDKVRSISTGIEQVPQLADNATRNILLLNESFNSITTNISGIAVTNPESIVSPIKTDVQPVLAQKTHVGRFLPTFLVLVIMFVCILLSSSLVLNERMSSAYFRNTITSTPQWIFLVGAYLTSFIIIALQLIVIALVLTFIIGYGANLLSLDLILPLILVISMFILLGIIIGYFASSQETANVSALFIITGALFFSNTILPLETIPASMKQLVLYNPFVVAEAALKKLVVFGFALEKVWPHVARLLWYNAILIILSYIGLRRSKENARK